MLINIESNKTCDREESCERIRKGLELQEGDVALDLCTGSGILGIYVAEKASKVIATDISPRALKFAKRNAERNKIKIDLWQSPHIFSTTLLNDYTCELYPKKYKHFDVKLINLIDNAVWKLARFNEADREDIDSILKTLV